MLIDDTFSLEKIALDESYVFDVIVEYEKSHYAGELKLTPGRIELRVMGESSETREFKVPWGDLETLVCHELNKTFLLVGLKARSARSQAIEHYPKHLSFSEVTFEVDYVIFSPGHLGSRVVFSGIAIRSETIASWVGHTETLDKIVEAQKAGSNVFAQPNLLNEFIVRIADVGALGISYDLTVFHSPPEYKAGLTFPPSLVVHFVNERTPGKTIEFLNDLYVLFAFVTGGELEIEMISFFHRGMGFGSQEATVYYPREKYPRRKKGRYALFPLGRKLRFDQLQLPEYPLEAFGAYFALEEKKRRYFEKYVRYRRLNNIEERFLGYFRILETLCFKKQLYFDEDTFKKLIERARPYLVKHFGDAKAVRSFTRRLPAFNESKYNTEKCVQDFFETIPGEISKDWRYQKQDIGSICKLRNDISHANDYDVDEFTMRQMTSFVEILLIFSLFDQLKVNLRDYGKIVGRFDDYTLVTGIPNLRITPVDKESGKKDDDEKQSE